MMRHTNNGAASIPLVLGIGILVLLIAIGVTSVETARVYLAQATADGVQATLYAETGVRDGLMQLARDKAFGSTTPVVYAIDMMPGGCDALRSCAQVAVGHSAIATGTVIVSALGYFRNARKGIEASVALDPSDWGALTVLGMTETLSPQLLR